MLSGIFSRSHSIYSPHCDCSFTITRTNDEDLVSLQEPDYTPARSAGQTTASDYFSESDRMLGPMPWRAEHARELEEVYAESQSLSHVRVLDWLPYQHAHSIPKFWVSDGLPLGITQLKAVFDYHIDKQEGFALTYRDSNGKEVPVFWKGTRILSNVTISLHKCLEVRS